MPANYQLIVDRVNNSDTMEVLVEMTPEMFSDTVSSIESKEKDIVTALKSMLGIYAKVKLVEPKSITRSEGKAVRVIDKRKILGGFYMYIHQISVFIENKPGNIANFTNFLAEHKIDMRAFQIAIKRFRNYSYYCRRSF